MPFTVIGLPTLGRSQGNFGMHFATTHRARSMPAILGFSQMRTVVSPSSPLLISVTKPLTAMREDILSDQRFASSTTSSPMVSSAYVVFGAASGALAGATAALGAVVVFFETGLGCGVCAALDQERPMKSKTIIAVLYISHLQGWLAGLTPEP